MNIIKVSLLLTFYFITLVGCPDKKSIQEPDYKSTAKNANEKVFSIASHPLYNPAKLMSVFEPLIGLLNANIQGVKFQLEGSTDYQEYEKKIKASKPDFLLPNPWQTLLAIKNGYHVIAEAGDSNDFKGIFIVKKNSSIQSFKDLKGKTISYPSHTALAACIMPQFMMHKNGINVQKDIINKFVGSQESSIRAVLIGESDVGVTWPPPWRIFQKEYPKESSELKVIWETEPLMNNSVMIKNDIPQEIEMKFKDIILNLDKYPEGREFLSRFNTQNFKTADDKSYDKVQKYIDRFEKEVRLVEKK